MQALRTFGLLAIRLWRALWWHREVLSSHSLASESADTVLHDFGFLTLQIFNLIRRGRTMGQLPR